jgi:hypothetical protein
VSLFASDARATCSTHLFQYCACPLFRVGHQRCCIAHSCSSHFYFRQSVLAPHLTLSRTRATPRPPRLTVAIQSSIIATQRVLIVVNTRDFIFLSQRPPPNTQLAPPYKVNLSVSANVCIHPPLCEEITDNRSKLVSQKLSKQIAPLRFHPHTHFPFCLCYTCKRSTLTDHQRTPYNLMRVLLHEIQNGCSLRPSPTDSCLWAPKSDQSRQR